LRSNRVLCNWLVSNAVDAFTGATLQMDGDGNSSTVTTALGRIRGAPNMGHDPHGRRHSTPAWLDLKTSDNPLERDASLSYRH